MNDGFLFINNFPLKSNIVDFISSFFAAAAAFAFMTGRADGGVYKVAQWLACADHATHYCCYYRTIVEAAALCCRRCCLVSPLPADSYCF